MKKLLFLAMAVLLLAACGNGDDNNADQNAQSNDDTAVEENNSNNNEELADFAEFETVTNEIGTNYEVEVTEDNDESRILLFKNNGEEVYESQYLKQNNLLKIKDLKEDRLIFNKFFKEQ